jgi:hypothetical protein
MIAQPCTYYESLAHALDTIDASRAGDSWLNYTQGNPAYKNHAINNPPSENWAESLSEFVGYCRNFDAPYLQERIERVAQLSEELDAEGLEASSVKRQQIWTRQGSRINPHRVLRGQLSTAWRRPVRVQRNSVQGRILIVLPLAYSHNIRPEQISWNTAATLALVSLAKQAGRMVSLYGVDHTINAYDKFQTGTLCIPLLTSDHVWSMHDTILTTSAAFSRRLCFRLFEIGQPIYGPISPCYGVPADKFTLRVWIENTLAPHAGIPAAACYVGPVQEDKIDSIETARYWLERQLTRLNS